MSVSSLGANFVEQYGHENNEEFGSRIHDQVHISYVIALITQYRFLADDLISHIAPVSVR